MKKETTIIYSDTNDGVGKDSMRDAFLKANYDSNNMKIDREYTYVHPKDIIKEEIKNTKNDKKPEPTDKFNDVLKGCEIINTGHMMIMEQQTCLDCKHPFTIPKDEYNWFIERKLEIPKRCKSCRNIKSLEKARIKTTEKVVEKKNKHTCINCGDEFYMTESHEKWFIDKNLIIPNRCPVCIKKKREEKSIIKE